MGRNFDIKDLSETASLPKVNYKGSQSGMVEYVISYFLKAHIQVTFKADGTIGLEN